MTTLPDRAATIRALSHAHGADLCAIAERAVRIALTERRRHRPAPHEVDPVLWEEGASFVTLLDDDGALLGCIGTMEAHRPLAVDVAHHAVAAAFEDPRLPPLTGEQFTRMTIEVSVLSPMTPLPAASHAELRADLRPGVDGLLVEAGVHRATFLPAVWEKLDHPDDFLTHLWAKAGLTPGAWPAGTRVWRYTTQKFHAPGPRA